MSKNKFIHNVPANGLLIDWKMIFRKYYALIKKIAKRNNINEQSFYMPAPPVDSAEWFVDLSERSIGKTTNYIIIGMLLNLHYGCRIEYVRTNKDGIMPKNAKKLFDVILQFDYIDEIYDGKWNSVTMKPRCWHLCKKDPEGNIIEESDEELMHMHSLNTKEVDDEKSVYNSPKGDFIIWDEAIPLDGITTEQQWLNFCQLHSTIRRQRLSVKCVILANTINKYTHLFQELRISGDILKMEIGAEKLITTPLGVKVWVHLIKITDNKISEQRISNNMKYYAFGNPNLNAIIGGAEWETKNYPHISQYISSQYESEQLPGYVYFNFQGKLLAWECWKHPDIGFYAFVKPYYREPKEDAVIYTLDVPKNKKEKFGIGIGTSLDKLIVRLLNTKKTYYSSNEVGAIFEAYFDTLRTMKKII